MAEIPPASPRRILLPVAIALVALLGHSATSHAEPDYIHTQAHAIPKHTTSEGSGYFAIVQGHDGKLYIGTAKYGDNAYLVSFDPKTDKMEVVVDAEAEIGIDRKGYAAQAKIHTRNNVGQSGRIYFGTKQGYPQKGESRDSYPGGHPMVYDPATGKTRVYDIPLPGHGIISVTPDESRNLAYISTCTDSRPFDHTHFMVLDLETGQYKDLGDMEHMYAFIVVDAKGRAYHPIRGGQIARYNPDTQTLDRLTQTLDGKPLPDDSLLQAENGHPINWEISPDGKTLWAIAMSGNQLYRYDLTTDGDTLNAQSMGPLLEGVDGTDCRALCVAPDGTVWAGVGAKYDGIRERTLHLVRYRPDVDPKPQDVGAMLVTNPDFTTFTDNEGEPLKWHHGYRKLEDGAMLPRYVVMGIAADDEQVYALTLYPFTLHEIDVP